MSYPFIQLTFLKSGLFTTIQDPGRRHLGGFGVPVGGWLDEKSALQANWLAGNHPYTPLLEITIQGPKIRFSGSVQIAITGADISPKLNEQPVPRYQTIRVNQGDILSFGRLNQGCRAYLAIRGKWKVEKELGSYSLLFRGKIQPTQRGLINNNSQVLIESKPFIQQRNIEPKDQLVINNPQTIRVLPGPEFDWFSREEIGQFFSYHYQLSTDSNRMGCRLEGHPLTRDSGVELISSGVIPGTVQIVNNGQPVILLADGQTTGGYPRFVNVMSEDMDKVAQLKPGDKLRFQLVPLVK